MDNGYISILLEKAREDRRLIYTPLLFIAFIFMSWLIIGYLSKGTIDVTVSGSKERTQIIITKANSNEEKVNEVVKSSSAAKIRVSSGSYKVTAVTEVPNGDTKQKLSSFKEVSVFARKTTQVEIKLDQAKVTSTQDLKDKPAFMSLANNKLYSTTVYGVSNIYNLADSTYSTVRKEPAYLRDVAGLCNFANGNSVAVDKQGSIYKIEGSEASPIDVFGAYEEESPEFEATSHIQGTKDFVCTKDGVILLGSAKISPSLAVSSISTNPYADLGNNYSTSQADESLWFFSAVNSDSFDGEGATVPDSAKTLIRLSSDGSQKKITLNSYASGVSVYSGSGFCFYYQKDITCGDIETGQLKKPFKLPDNKPITNIQAVDGKRIAYSFGNSAWILNVETGQSTQLYSSDHDIISDTMVIDRSLKIISFGTQKVASNESSYLAPVIEYADIGL